MKDNRYPYSDPRFKQPEFDKQIQNPYDFDSRLLADIEQRNLEPVLVIPLTLTAAGSQLISTPGYHFCLYGRNNASPPAVNTTAIVSVFIQKSGNDGSTPFPAKHARGFSGPFTKLWLEWVAQAGVYADLVIFKNSEKPWIDGESAT